jgi:amidophosphoribosyltransferase
MDNERFSTIDKKINILGAKVAGKNIILCEDSIVRGDTTKIIIDKLRKSGAKKVFVFSTFPKVIGPCFYGIDMSTYKELIGAINGPEEIAKIIGADGICYQSLDKLIAATEQTCDQLCLACVTGKYPTRLAQELADVNKEKFLKGHDETKCVYETEESTSCGKKAN